MSIILYILSIVAANIVTASTRPFHIFVFLVPAGTLLIGLTILLRNRVQVRYGRRATYIAIVVALVASAISSHLLGDPLTITTASALSFLLSEAADTETFTRLRATLAGRVLIGGTVGSVIDSCVFVVVGLSPLGAGFVPWAAVPYVILGQLIVKVIMQALGAWGVAVVNKRCQR